MLNSATLTAILVNILAALFFTCITICIATHFAKKKANETDKKLINNKCKFSERIGKTVKSR